MLRKSYNNVFHNMKVKKYPQGMCKITVASRNIFREDGWEVCENAQHVKIPKPQSSSPVTRNDSIRRSITSVYDIVLMNENTFKYFVTLTFDPDKVNSKDPKEIISILRAFLKNMTSRHGLKYILIPENHKKGGIHLHGLFNECLTLTDSGTRKVKGYEKPLRLETLRRKGIDPATAQTVYNLPQWKYGFSTAIEIFGDGNGIAGYITKYITKDLSKIFGNYYYAGGNIVRKVPVSLDDIDYSSFICDYEYYCEPAKTGFKYLTTD